MIGGVKVVFLLCFALVSAIAAVHRTLFGARAQARKRLRNAPRELTDGAVVTLTGVVRAKSDTMTAPLSGRQAVAFSATARVYEGNGRHRKMVDQFNQQDMVDFVLETKHGLVEIEAARAELEYAPDPLIPRKLEREQDFLTKAGSDASARNGGFDEIVIAPGMKISVHGVVRIEAAPSEDYREAGRRIVMAGHPAHPLTIGRPV